MGSSHCRSKSSLNAGCGGLYGKASDGTVQYSLAGAMRNDEAPPLALLSYVQARHFHPCFEASPFSALLADWYNAVTLISPVASMSALYACKSVAGQAGKLAGNDSPQDVGRFGPEKLDK
jgi:hypothetical protein